MTTHEWLPAILRSLYLSDNSVNARIVSQPEQLVRLLLPDSSMRTTQVIKGEMSAKTTYQRSAKGPVSISECSADGKYVALENTGRKVTTVALSAVRMCCIRRDFLSDYILQFLTRSNCVCVVLRCCLLTCPHCVTACTPERYRLAVTAFAARRLSVSHKRTRQAAIVWLQVRFFPKKCSNANWELSAHCVSSWSGPD